MRYLCVLSICLLTACASANTTSESRNERIAATLADTRVGERVDRICFTKGIDRFSNATENSVVLRRAVNDEYLVLTRSCPDLDNAQSLALRNHSSCLRRNDFIQVFRSAFGPSRADLPGFQSCQIDAIYEWDRDADKTTDEGMTSAQ